MTRTFLPAGVVLLLAAAALGDQDPGLVMRDWRILNERSNPVATFVRLDGDKVVLRGPDGSQRSVELWKLEGRELAYLQRRRCVWPAKVRRVEPPAGRNLLIDLSARSLPPGPLKTWPNQGALGGAFHALAAPPLVADVAGRRAVSFSYGPAIVAMDFHTMVADFLAPPAISDGESFSVAAWLYNPGVADPAETFLSWHTLGGDDGTDIRFGRRGRYSFLTGAYAGPMGTLGFDGDDLKRPNAWHHVAHVFTGGPDGEMRLYIDGEPAGTKRFERTVRIGPAGEITPGAARLNGELFLREGKPVAVRFYLGRRDGHHWTNVYPKEKDRWNRVVEVTREQSGPVSVTVDGLEPGTEYVWRIQVFADEDHIYWSDGPGRFRTAGGDGAAGEAVARDQARHVFLGSSWGSTWDWAVTPRYFYTGAIAELKAYDHALSEREVRVLSGRRRPYAPAPADGAAIDGLAAALAWKPCAEGARSCRVFLSKDRAAVAAGRKEALRAEVSEPKLDAGKLDFAATYYWRVDEVTGPPDKAIAGDVWSFRTPDGDAAEPVPADRANGVNVQTAYFTWKPGPFARAQTVYLDTDLAAVAAGKARHVMKRGGRDGAAHFNFPSLACGRRYYWRVESANRDGLPTSKGKVWSFATEDFVKAEGDGIVVEPYPQGVRQWGRVSKFVEGGGHPIIAADDTPDLAMLRARKTCLKVLDKRPDLHYRLAVSNTAGSLENETRLGWTELVRNTYGATRNMLLDQNFYGGANMLMHEMGHQLHMNGMSQLDLDFDHRLQQTYLAAMKTLKYLGHYGSNNMWEYIACAANLYINDGHADDEVYPRDRLRREDPRLYFLLNEYWSGDRRIELNAHEGVAAGDDGAVREWRNLGGVEYWGRRGWGRYSGTVGSFKPIGRPVLATVRGVSAVRLAGGDALVWSQRMRPEMSGDREWSVEFWAFRDAEASGRGVLLSWGEEGDRGVRLRWGGGETSFDFGAAGRGAWRRKPAAGAWRHIALVHEAGGLAGGPAPCKVYVDGQLDHQAACKLDLAPAAAVVIGGSLKDGRVTDGLAGAVAHVRLYDYDMHPLQVAEHYERERAYYDRDDLAVAGRLLVDLDARRLETCPVYDHRPLYPAGLNRPWVRSWVNRGTLGGKVHNNTWRRGGSTPIPRTIDGVEAIRFQGKDYMASGFACGPAGTVEAWVRRDGPEDGGTVLELAGCRVRAGLVPAGGWRHLAVVSADGAPAVFLDGRKVDRPVETADCSRLHLGAHWDGSRWTDCFDGALAQLRVHGGALSEGQIRRNFQAGPPAARKSPPHARGPAVVGLDAADLQPGRIEQWPNRGQAGGTFAAVRPGDLPAPTVPLVRDLAGRRAVCFDGLADCLESTVPTPASVTGSRPFTVEAWVLNPSLQHTETLFSLAPEAAKKSFPDWHGNGGVECGYGAGGYNAPSAFANGTDGFNLAWRRPPDAGRWRHLAWVYTGGRAGTVRLYVDGQPDAPEQHVSLGTYPGFHMYIGSGWNTAKGLKAPFSGSVSRLTVYDYARTPEEIRAAAAR